MRSTTGNEETKPKQAKPIAGMTASDLVRLCESVKDPKVQLSGAGENDPNHEILDKGDVDSSWPQLRRSKDGLRLDVSNASTARSDFGRLCINAGALKQAQSATDNKETGLKQFNPEASSIDSLQANLRRSRSALRCANAMTATVIPE